MRSRPPHRSTSSTSNSVRAAKGAIPDRISRPGWFPSARILLRADGVFEGLLGVLLVLSLPIGLYDALALPAPASRPVVLVIGLLLLPLLPILLRASRTPQRWLVLALAGANGAGALVFALWVLLWHAVFHPTGAVFVLLVAAILAVLAALQAGAALAAS